VPQESGAAKRLWRFRDVGGADEVRAARVGRYFLGIGRMSRSVQMSAVLVMRGDCECSYLRIERMNASPATARGEPPKTSLVVIVDPQ
jgi:hypothetical protein